MATNSAWDTHGRVTDLFLNMARTQHGQDKVDAELQVALGVLFYTNGEYDRAQDCFLAALNFRPKVRGSNLTIFKVSLLFRIICCGIDTVLPSPMAINRKKPWVHIAKRFNSDQPIPVQYTTLA